MQITEKQKQQLIDLNDSRVNEIFELGLEVGKWYKKKDFGKLMFYFNGEFSKRGYNPNYGLNYDGIFSDEIGVFKREVNEYYEATHQEVAIALIKEAKRRGFNKGVKFKSLSENGKIRTISDKTRINYYIDESFLTIYTSKEEWENKDDVQSNPTIFKDGVWAEIIDDKAELKQEIKELRNKLKNLEEKL